VRTVVGVCGYSGAGKSTFCREMARRFGLPALSTGEVVRRQVVARGRQLTPADVARVSDEIRAETGGRFVLVLAADLAAAFARAPAVLVDCLREESDLLALRELADRVALVAVTATDEVRAARSLGRDRPGDPTSQAGLLALDDTDRRLGVEQLLAAADYAVANDGELADFLARSAVVVAEILRL
jgi:dephospho-CoA kinase